MILWMDTELKFRHNVKTDIRKSRFVIHKLIETEKKEEKRGLETLHE